MEMSYKVQTEVTLVLQYPEAKWLMEFIQNYPGDPNEEPGMGNRMRLELFENLRAALK